MRKYLLLLITLTMTSTTFAAITFVDADLTNTTINGAAPVNGVNYIDNGTSGDGNNGLWGIRARSSVNGGFIWTTDAVGDETTEPLITTITINGAPGTYTIYGCFNISQQGTSDWDAAFTLGGGNPYTTFHKTNARRARTSDFEGSVLVEDVNGTSYMFIARIGIVTTTTANQQVSVYVQGADRDDADDRTWYDGVGYQPVENDPVLSNLTINKKDSGYRGIWYYIPKDGIVKYGGGLGTYCAKHRPMAIYSAQADKTFFCYGGTAPGSNTRLWHMVSEYNHATDQVSLPTILLDKGTNDAHDNPVISMDSDGYVWVFSTSHGTDRPSYIHKSKTPYNIDEFELIHPTKVDDSDNVVTFDNFSYFQIWHRDADGFFAFWTRYGDPVQRTIQFITSPDGVHWSKTQRIATVGVGSYQVSAKGAVKVGTAFNIHPVEGGLDRRTNLYYVESADNGQTWQTAHGTTLNLPVLDAEELTTPALIHDYHTEGLNVYLKDIIYDPCDNPAILYVTTNGPMPGPEDGPRTWHIAHFNGTTWDIKTVTTSTHAYDTGSLYLEADGTWRIIGPTEPGPQYYDTGGEIAMWVSNDQGDTWTKTRDITQNSTNNHTYVRSPVNANDEFYAFWADGDASAESISNFYFCNKAGDVTQLPRGTSYEHCESLAPQDINGDCDVDLEDFSIFAGNWFNTGSFEPAEPTAGDVDEDFEIDSFSELTNFTYEDVYEPVMTTAQALSGSKSMFWDVDDVSKCQILPFGSETADNCVVSVWVYLDENTGAGRSFFSVYDKSGNSVLLMPDMNASGEYDILYRIGSTYTRPLEVVAPGWHQLSFAIYANNAVGIYFDNQYLDTAETFTSGLYRVRFGKPWAELAGCKVFFDKLTITQNCDTIGGGSPLANDFYEDFEYYWTENLADYGYDVTGSPSFTTAVQTSAQQSFFTGSSTQARVIKELPATLTNCRYSAHIYIPPTDNGEGYLATYDPTGKYSMIVVTTNPMRVYHRIEGSRYGNLGIDAGWHLMSTIVDYLGRFHMFFDNNYLGRYDDTIGLSAVRFGDPWGQEGYTCFDAVTLVTDLRGGFFGDWNTTFTTADFNQTGLVDTQDLISLTNKWLTISSEAN